MKAFARFWYDFVVGDDWVVAVGVIVILGIAALLVGAGAAAWVWTTLAVAGLLALSVWRAARANERSCRE
jgi:hypothetical protein